MEDVNREDAIELIKSNIGKFGRHIYMVSGGPEPRYAYTIGLSSLTGFELVLAGASFYFADDVKEIINEIASRIHSPLDLSKETIALDRFGVFHFREVHASWRDKMMLGAFDYYENRDIRAFQIVPDERHWTADIPILSNPWDEHKEPAWKWLVMPWVLQVSPQSVVTTNLDALRGERVTEAARWEETEWEIFAGIGPDVPHDEIRVVPLATLLGIDPSTDEVLNLKVGDGLYRDANELSWLAWNASNA